MKAKGWLGWLLVGLMVSLMAVAMGFRPSCPKGPHTHWWDPRKLIYFDCTKELISEEEAARPAR